MIQDMHVLCSIQLSLHIVIENSPQQDAATNTILHRWDGDTHVMSGASFSPDPRIRIEAKRINLDFIRTENHVSHTQ